MAPLTRRLAAALTFAVTLAACAALPSGSTTAPPSAEPIGPLPSDLVAGLRVETDIAYTDTTDCGGRPCRVPGDVIAPTEGSEMPTVVLLGGGGKVFADRRYQADLAAELARRGVVVFLLSYRSAATGNYDSDSYDDVRCAIRYARAETARFGGDPQRVVAIGHSQGGLMALEIALQSDEEADGCLADGSGRPDGVIGLGAPRPRVNRVADPAPPVWLFSGAEDGDADGTAQRLRDQGADAASRELSGVTHDGITDPASAPDVVELILEAIGSI
jgi:acetyl esterase/lipase